MWKLTQSLITIFSSKFYINCIYFSLSFRQWFFYFLLLFPYLAHFLIHFPSRLDSMVQHFNHSLANILIYYTTLELPIYCPLYTICCKSHGGINYGRFVHWRIPGAKYNTWHIQCTLNKYILNTQNFWLII